jgi:uncharacterized membrane protein YoaK (UPF0700 family)
LEHLANPNPVFELFVGTLILIVVIFVHGVGIRNISRQFSKSWAHVTSTTPHWRLNLMLSVTIAALALLHFAETLIWAVPLYVREIIPSHLLASRKWRHSLSWASTVQTERNDNV